MERATCLPHKERMHTEELKQLVTSCVMEEFTVGPRQGLNISVHI